MFLEGIAEFNRHRFFEAHEVWEDLWRGHRDDDRTFLQGLIQVAAGCYHLQTDNLSGALSLLLKGQAKLRRYGSAHAGIDLDGLMSRCDALAGCVAEIRRGEDSVIDDHRIPTIALLTADHVSAHVKTVDPEGDRSWRQ